NRRSTKVTVVGAGNVGMAVVQGLLVQKLADEIVIFDLNSDRLKGEMMDAHYAGAYLPLGKIHFSDKYSATANSDLCIVATGIVKKDGESRYDLLSRNIAKFKKLVPAIVDYSPNCVILVVSNPVDQMTYVAWKLSGLSAGRVFGAGTNLDSSTYQFLIGGHFNVSPHDVK
ncbi:l-lactate dehydrogenase, partial [Genlisea aurea]